MAREEPKERIIPITLETDPPEDTQRHTFDTSNGETLLTLEEEKLGVKRTLPRSNVTEKIIIVVDSAEDENFTPFKLNNSQCKPLEMIKRGVEIFLTHKHQIDKKHEFALVVLNENSVLWLVNFSNNINKIIKALEGIKACQTEDIFDLNQLFDAIIQKIEIPEIRELEGVVLPPPYVVRVILFYGRSYTIPKVILNAEVDQLLQSPCFTLDVLMTHEPIDDDNNCDKIFNVLQNLDKKGFAYFFSVARDTKTLFNSTAKLLGHPLQRPIQKLANYSIERFLK